MASRPERNLLRLRKRIFCGLLALTSVVCHAQSPWQIGFQIQPFGLTQSDVYPGPDGAYAYPGIFFREDLGFNYKLGVVAYRELGRVTWLQSGILFSRKRFSTRPVLSGAGQVADTVRMTTRLSDIQVPLSLHFRYDIYRWGIVASPHVFTGFRLRSAMTFEQVGEGPGYLPMATNNNRFYLPAFFGFGLSAGLYYRPYGSAAVMAELGGEYEFASRTVARPMPRIPGSESYFLKLTFVQDLRR
ncbi:MAG: hypothetical protein MUD08_05070 [Cytophagales bacterium]|nr:hypothetical protein [Cytophagales bacterium]